jgi:predicted peroxiredoxin
MENKKFLFVLTHATTRPIEVLVYFKIASNMKAFDDSVDIVFFLVDEGVQLARKGVAEGLSLEFEGKQVNLGEMMEMLSEFDVKFYVCQAFLPGLKMTKEDLIGNAEERSSAYLGELLLNGYTPFSLNV